MNVGGACETFVMTTSATLLQQALPLLEAAAAALDADAATPDHEASDDASALIQATEAATRLLHSIRVGAARSGTVPFGVAHDSLGVLIEEIVAEDALLAQASARQVRCIDRARQYSEAIAAGAARPRIDGWTADRLARREITTELACALRISERRAENMVEESRALVHTLPSTLAALDAGDITYSHARVIVDQSYSIDKDARAGFEEVLLPVARASTVTKLERKARRLREQLLPETITARHLKSVADRHVELCPDRDGMAWLNAWLPAETAHGIYAKLTQRAESLKCPDETRTLAQLRADVFADLLVDGHTVGDWPIGIQATVLVTVPALSLVGRTDNPGILEGHGPIDPDTARRIAGTAKSWVRLLTHPETGAVLSVGRDRYSVPPDLRLWLRVRDETCRHPGCNRLARHCHIDHTKAWEHDGPTNHDNLAHLCESHHRDKHHTAWDLAQIGGGVLEFTSPAGRKYTTEPATAIHLSPHHAPTDPPPDEQTDGGWCEGPRLVTPAH